MSSLPERESAFGGIASVFLFSGLHLDNVASPNSKEVNKVYTGVLALYELNIRSSVWSLKPSLLLLAQIFCCCAFFFMPEHLADKC